MHSPQDAARRINVSDSPLKVFSAYLDGHLLSDAEVRELRTWISSNPANAEELVRFGVVHAALADRLVLGRLLEELANHNLSVISSDALAEAIREIEVTSPRVARVALPIEQDGAEGEPARWVTPLAVAAVIAFVMAGAWVIRTAPPPTLASPSRSALVTAPSLPENKVDEKPIVATVGAMFDPEWTFDEGKASGDSLREGSRLDLLDGVVQLDMASGAAVVLEGPCRVELQGPESLRLADGKAAVRIDGAAESFIVHTPSAKVTDLGTEFGVNSSPAGETLVSVFDGAVVVGQPGEGHPRRGPDARSIGQQRIDAGFEMNVASRTSGQAKFGELAAVVNDRVFVRPDEVEIRVRARQGSIPDQKLAAHFARLRMGGLLAYQWFDQVSAGVKFVKGIGPQGLYAQGDVSVRNDQDARPGLDVQSSDVFLPFDVSGAGTFSQAGLISPTGLIGQSGAELWMTWRTQRYSIVADQVDSAGLSLMFGDRNDFDEPLFVGHAAFGGAFCIQSAWGGEAPPAGQRITSQVDFDAAAAGVQSRTIDDQPHVWVMRIEFADDQDRVSLWVDAPWAELNATAPQAVLEVSNIEFDRVRLAAHRGDELWRYGNLAVARNLKSLLALVHFEEPLDKKAADSHVAATIRGH
jgi:hypothetical protein